MTQVSKPHIVGFTPWVGQPSNVWMYRQFSQLADQMKTIVTWEYLNQDQFSLPNTDVRIVPEKYAEPLRGWTRTLDTMITPRTGGARFGFSFNRWLQNQLKDCGAQAVLGQFGHYAMVAEIACRPLSIPVFAHFHGFDMSVRLRKKRYMKSLESHWHPFAGMIVVAEYQQEILLELGVEPERIALIPCGAPTREIAEQAEGHRSQSSRQDNECQFLFVGRFTKKKDPISVLKAFQHCHLQHPHARLRLGGFGEMQEECEEWIRQQPAEFGRAIQFLGMLKPEEVIREMALADVFVQHSRTAPSGDKEGWPVVIGEAMAASLPIVSTRHAGIVDQVVEGHNGYLCDEGDWQQMGKDMTWLAADPKLRHQMGDASLERAFQYDATDQIEKLRDFINSRVAVQTTTAVRQAA